MKRMSRGPESLLEVASGGAQVLRGSGIYHKVSGLSEAIKFTSSSPGQLPRVLTCERFLPWGLIKRTPWDDRQGQ